MTCKQIIREYLERHGHDGLHDGDECGCVLGDFMPCGEEGITQCVPAKRAAFLWNGRLEWELVPSDTCLHCRQVIDGVSRSDRKYCSGKCRQAAHCDRKAAKDGLV